MKQKPLAVLLLLFFSCGNVSVPEINSLNTSLQQPVPDTSSKYDVNSWQYFLQHLQVVDKPVVDFKGKPVSYQQKQVGIIPYDVGTTDLQQCADALMRLRAEYLFQQKRYDELGFHFVSGDYYTWNDYCKGKRPVAKASGVQFITTTSSFKTHESLRRYLDVVYTLCKHHFVSQRIKTGKQFRSRNSCYLCRKSRALLYHH